ncbi:adenylosuccinate lyase [Campylobacter porcelli]|uniref:DnaJ domain protein n=1 Tax=Campylobacter porcelli TaxID=1660073 RepID=A0A1X9SXI7_9BACT|nr:adenylosuccinate lyase [Campylobacter sp. RM6137]ARR00916.1 DnaJ domain protein [Campylobacter sp. RM6137]
MEITQTLESITIVTDDCDLYLNLIYKIRQSFANVIGTRDRIIIFYNENELIQRKYLLKFIANLYRKTVGSGVEFWLTHHKNIKLIYKNPTSLQILIDIDIKFEDSKVLFDLKNSEELFAKYLMRGFNDANCDYFPRQNWLFFTPKSQKDIDTLSNIINIKEHLKYTVNFNYNKDEFELFKRRFNALNSKEYKRKFTMLATLLEDHFHTLGCEVGDDYDTVRASYLNLIKIYHPDRNAIKSDEIKKSYTDKFQKIGLAYEALKPYFQEQKNFIKSQG